MHNRLVLLVYFRFIAAFMISGVTIGLHAQSRLHIEVVADPAGHEISVYAEGRPFTRFIYPDSLEKPVLYPLYAPHEIIVTRGFPLATRPLESTDHPHHLGLWFNYENLNGLDFWNNSYAIPADKKHLYGWIRTDSVLETISGKTGRITYQAHWEDAQHHQLLLETTSFIFTADKYKRIVDRITRLTAMQDDSFPDSKDGLLGMRVTRELQLPSTETKKFTDIQGNTTSVRGQSDSLVNGNYLTSEGKEGDGAWGTRASWCLLYGKIKGDTVSIAIIDHPSNPGYPTYWHARGYGLFAANPLGQKIFSNNKETLGFSLKKGRTVVFRYRIVLATGRQRLDKVLIGTLASDFAKMN